MPATTTRALHEGWTFCELDAETIPNSDAGAWLPAEVPGHVHLDLLRNGVIPDPFERMHERTVQWVDDRDWAYRCTFTVTAAELEGAQHVLRFEGLDTIATVVLNDEVVAQTDDQHIAHEADVTSRLVAGDNVLEVRFASAERVGAERRAAYLASDPDLDVFRRGLMSRSMVAKAQYSWGWDWGPRLRGCGIWKPVTLVRVPTARLTDWWWRSSFDDDGSCTVTVGADSAGSLRVHLDGQVVQGDEVAVRIADPVRWWPNGRGDQHLYDLRVELLDGDEVVDAREARIGLREVELVREPDEAGESFLFRVNGEDTFVLGANWIPDDSFPARTHRLRVFELVRMARDCGMNMLRIWGGGLYESEDFYDACDELGLLVWQDFPYACALYPESDEFAAAADRQARSAIRRVRNHTSLALWCGNNENQWLGGLGAWGQLPRILGERLYDVVLPAAVADEDPGRPYWPSSPWGSERNKSGDADGDSHHWNVWHGEGDWVHYAKARPRFVSEFGFAGPPDLRTLEGCLDHDDLGVDTPAMRWHDKTNKGYDTYLGYIALHHPPLAT
ncbi:MAG TPA: hypothetical protein VEA78_10945, partial [Acidimicrobiales bacterium]|nr:hypothetical protein [Acidimicrobiales bacterium]